MYDVVEIEKEDEKTGKIKKITKFVKKPFLDPFLRLIIVDEVSMVSKKLLNDLLSFNIPIITLGDPLWLLERI